MFSKAYADRLRRRGRSLVHRYLLASFPRTYYRSARPVVVVIPLAVKDIRIASICVKAIRKYLLHDITEIVVVGQSSNDIERFCHENSLKYIDEADILDRELDNVISHLGLQRRSGWIKQQFLKLSVDLFLDGDDFLIFDADTILVRPVAFLEEGSQILWTADDLVEEYHEFTEAVIGRVKRRNHSFVAHCMLFQRSILKQMRTHVENLTGETIFYSMIRALSKSKTGYMSEYELYAYFMVKEIPELCLTKYWYNRKADLSNEQSLAKALKKYRRFNFLSDHNKPYARPSQP